MAEQAEKEKPAKQGKDKDAPAKNEQPKDEKGKGKRGKKDKKDKKGAAGGLSVAGHPRASRQVRRAKGWGGLAGFALAAFVSWHAGVSVFDLGVRALLAGVAGYLVGFGCSVAAWRAILTAELHARIERAQAPDAAAEKAAS